MGTATQTSWRGFLFLTCGTGRSSTPNYGGCVPRNQMAVTSIIPQTAPTTGGNQMMVTGEYFLDDALRFSLGGVACTSSTRLSINQGICVVPAGTSSNHQVSVLAYGRTATGPAAEADRFSYTPPTVTTVTPAKVSLDATAPFTFTISGANFGATAGARTVTIGTYACAEAAAGTTPHAQLTCAVASAAMLTDLGTFAVSVTVGTQATVPAASGAPVEVCVVGAADQCICPVGQSYRPSAGRTWSACTACEGGTYGLDGLACKTCPAGAICAGGAAFTSRTAGAVWTRGASEYTLSSCPEGHVKTSADVHDQARCEVCSAADHLVADKTDPNAEKCVCASGHFRLDGVCAPCPFGTYKSAIGDATMCTSCTAGASTASEGATSAAACACTAANTEMLNGTCQCKAGAGGRLPTECALCPDGEYKNFTGNQMCVSCTPNAPQGSTTDGLGSTSGNACRCKSANAAIVGNQCQCNAGAGGNAITGVCARCPSDQYKSAVGNDVCVGCPAGAYTGREGALARAECACESPFSVVVGEACECVEGAGGDARDRDRAEQCSQCDSRSYKNFTGNKGCALCPTEATTGRIGALNRTECACISSNAEFGPDGNCQCRAGSGGSAIDPNQYCALCGEEYFKVAMNNTGCAKCIDGATTGKEGSVRAADCQCKENTVALEVEPGKFECRCAAGAQGTAASAAGCTPCALGFYKAINGDGNCEPCPDGSLSTRPGALSESECICKAPSSQMSGEPGNPECRCVEGAGGDARDTAVAAAERCQLCPESSFKAAEGNEDCDPCPAGASTGLLGSRRVDECMCFSNFATIVNGSCVCARGAFGGGVQGGCELCPAGTYKGALGDAARCDSCPSGATSAPGSLRKADCFCGPELFIDLAADDLVCRACPLGGNCTDDMALVVQEGFWRESNESSGIYHCPLGTIACQAEEVLSLAGSVAPLNGSAPGSADAGSAARRRRLLQELIATDEVYDPLAAVRESRLVVGTGNCTPGHKGRLCNSCEDGYAYSPSYGCELCTESGAAASVYIMAVVIVLATLFLYWYLFWRHFTPECDEWFHRCVKGVIGAVKFYLGAVPGLRWFLGIKKGESKGGSESPKDSAKVHPAKKDEPAVVWEEKKVTLWRRASLKRAASKAGFAGDSARAADCETVLNNASDAAEEARAQYDATKETLEKRRRQIRGAVKVVLSFYQVMSMLPIVLDEVEWPSLFVRISDITSFVSLDFATLPNLSCMGPKSFDYKLALYVFFPLGVGLAILGTEFAGGRLYHWRTRGGRRWPGVSAANLERFKDDCRGYLQLFLFLIYPSVSTVVFSTFSCTDMYGTLYLKQDYDLECFAGQHLSVHVPLGLLGIVLYPLGVPLLTAFLLVKRGVWDLAQTKIERKREERIIFECIRLEIIAFKPDWYMKDGLDFTDLNKDDVHLMAEHLVPGIARAKGASRVVQENAIRGWAKENEDTLPVGEVPWDAHVDTPDSEMNRDKYAERRLVRSMGIVFATYHAGALFFELWEMFRKLLLTSILQFVEPGSATQLTFAILVSFAAVLIGINYTPYPDSQTDYLSQVALTQLFLASFAGLLLFVEVDDKTDRSYFEYLAIACQFGLPLFPIAVKLVDMGRRGVGTVLAELLVKGVSKYLGPKLEEINQECREVIDGAIESKGVMVDAIEDAVDIAKELQGKAQHIQDQAEEFMKPVRKLKEQAEQKQADLLRQIEDLDRQAQAKLDQMKETVWRPVEEVKARVDGQIHDLRAQAEAAKAKTDKQSAGPWAPLEALKADVDRELNSFQRQIEDANAKATAALAAKEPELYAPVAAELKRAEALREAAAAEEDLAEAVQAEAEARQAYDKECASLTAPFYAKSRELEERAAATRARYEKAVKQAEAAEAAIRAPLEKPINALLAKMEELQAEVDAAVKKAHDAVDLIKKPFMDAKAKLEREIEEAKRRWQDAKAAAEAKALKLLGLTDTLAKSKAAIAKGKETLEEMKADLQGWVRNNRVGKGMRYLWGLLTLETQMNMLAKLVLHPKAEEWLTEALSERNATSEEEEEEAADKAAALEMAAAAMEGGQARGRAFL